MVLKMFKIDVPVLLISLSVALNSLCFPIATLASDNVVLQNAIAPVNFQSGTIVFYDFIRKKSIKRQFRCPSSKTCRVKLWKDYLESDIRFSVHNSKGVIFLSTHGQGKLVFFVDSKNIGSKTSGNYLRLSCYFGRAPRTIITSIRKTFNQNKLVYTRSQKIGRLYIDLTCNQ